MSRPARLSPVSHPDRDARFAGIQQAVADCGGEMGEMLTAIANGVLMLVPSAIGAVVRIGEGDGERQAVAGLLSAPTLTLPIVRQGAEVGDIRVQARRSLNMQDHGSVAMLAGLAAVALSTSRQVDHVYDTLDRYQRCFHATFLYAPVGMAHVAPDGRFLLVNDQFAVISGHSRAALLEHGFRHITHPDDLEADNAHVMRLLAGEADNYGMEKRYIRPDGSEVWVKLTVSLVRDTAGEPDFFVSVIEDVSAIRHAHEAAIRDPLTSLLNRRGFIECTGRPIDAAAHSRRELSIVYLDLDGFKRINDERGHQAGDACLVAVAQAIGDIMGSSGIAARLGGDEFVILMPHLSAAHAQLLTEQLRERLQHLGEGLSGSFGLVPIVPSVDTEVEQLIALADQAMFAAKRAGRNCVRSARL